VKASLSFVELAVSDWHRSRRWYREALRLEEAFVDEAGRFALFAAGPTRLALKEGTAVPGGVVLSFEVDDLAAWATVFGAEVKESAEGYRRVRVSDPDGHVIVLFQMIR
jgi:catechol 2,3-dioxygenase-like lactoylglutathione lyase family enzyme